VDDNPEEFSKVIKSTTPPPKLEDVTEQDSVRVINSDGGAFNTATTTWQQWLRFSHPANEAMIWEGEYIDYTYQDYADVGKIKKRSMSPRVALMSTLIRALGPHCPRDLSFASLKHANLHNTILSSASHKVVLSGAWLEKANMVECQLKYATMRGCNLRHVDMQGSDLTGTNMQDATLVEAEMIGAHLARVNMFKTRLENCLWTPSPPLPQMPKVHRNKSLLENLCGLVVTGTDHEEVIGECFLMCWSFACTTCIFRAPCVSNSPYPDISCNGRSD
jgi:hypothetical protein